MSEIPNNPAVNVTAQMKMLSAQQMERGALYEQNSCEFLETYWRAQEQGTPVDPASGPEALDGGYKRLQQLLTFENLSSLCNV